MVIDRYSIRKQNEIIVLEHIIKYGEISRAELAQQINMNKATISEITKKFLEENLIEEIGTPENENVVGRKPILLKFNQYAGVTISIDLGYDYVASALHYLNGEIVELSKEKDIYVNSGNIYYIVDKLVNKYKDLAENLFKNKCINYSIVGLAIAIHGITYENKIIFTPYYDLDKIDLGYELTKRYNIPCYVENEANLTALAEQAFYNKYSKLVSLSIHSGVGAGIILDGELYTGKEGHAGEIGHEILIPDGKACPCGNHGCMEQYVSERAIIYRYKSMTGDVSVGTDEICQAYNDEDIVAKDCINYMVKYLAITLNNLIVNFAPEVIFLNSPIIRLLPELVERIEDAFNSSFTKNVSIKNSEIGAEATLYGAAAVGIKGFLGVGSLLFSDKE
jgi:Transcriptional regulator/sugar kinase